jgi:DNA-binding MarR family transcriptional regulator
MLKSNDQSILTLMKEVRTLIDKCLKTKVNLGNFTMPQTMIIYNLAQHGTMKISDLSEKMGLTNSTVSGIVDRLEDQGVVARQRSTTDRRVVYVEFTPEHKKRHEDMHDQVDQYFEEILSEIPSQEMESIINSFSILKEAFSNHLEKADIPK